MTVAKAVFKTGRDLVAAFLKDPLPKELFLLSRYGKVEPPWAPPQPGADAESYASAWTRGYDGGPIRAAFRWVGQHGEDPGFRGLWQGESSLCPPKSPLLADFAAIPEVERMIKYLIRNGAAIHDVRDLLVGFHEVWDNLDRIRPDTWSADDLLDLLVERTGKGRDPDIVPASMLFLWNSSNHPYAAKQIARGETLLLTGLRAVLPASSRTMTSEKSGKRR